MNFNTVMLPDNYQITLPENVANVIWATHERTRAPIEMILSSFLTNASLLTQGFAQVNRPIPNGLTDLMLYLITIADSGERKSTVDGILSKKIKQIEERESQNYPHQLIKYKLLMRHWRKALYVIEEEIHEETESLPYELVNEFVDVTALTDHYKVRPKKPMPFQMIYNNTTPEALVFNMYHSNLNAGLISSEGNSIISGYAMRDMAMLNDMWSGFPQTINRKSTDSFTLKNAHLTVSIMIQYAAFKKYLDKHGYQARGTGLFARFLINYPRSTQGSRYLSAKPLQFTLDDYEQRVEELMEKNVEIYNKPQPLIQLDFEPDAKQLWQETFNRIEYSINPNLPLNFFKDYASKMMENTSRVAGVMHYFVHGDSTRMISKQMLESAISIVNYYTDQFLILFYEKPQHEQDSVLLKNWLFEKINELRNGFNQHISYSANGHYIIKKNIIKQFGPNSLRSKGRMEAAINHLVMIGDLQLLQSQNPRDKTIYMQLNSYTFGTCLHLGNSLASPR